MKGDFFYKTLRFLPLIFFLGTQLSSLAQDVILETQSDVDAFNPATTMVNGNLHIGGLDWQSTSDITNLTPLANLQEINGNLIIKRTSLNNLASLNNLISISGNFRITGNIEITNIVEFDNLTTVGDTFDISVNSQLVEVAGFNNLISIGKDFRVGSNGNLTRISGLTSLLEIGETIHFQSNSLLTNFDGLSNLTTIGKDIYLYGNQSITNISGFKNVSSAQSIRLQNNKNLRNVDALINIKKLDGSLSIVFNDALRDIDGLKNISSVGGDVDVTGAFNIKNLVGLSSIISIGGSLNLSINNNIVNLDDLCNLTSIGSNLDISSNKRLVSISGLKNILSINGALTISGNTILVELDGLENIKSVGENLQIRGNSNLVNCCAIHDLLENANSSIGGDIDVSNNPSECSSVNTILDSRCNMYLITSLTPPCVDIKNGAIHVFAKNYKVTPLSYLWERQEDGITGSDTSNTSTFSIDTLDTGTYNITVTNTIPDTAIILDINLSPTSGAVFEIIKVTTTNTSNGFQNGSISLTTAGGVAPYEYEWDGPVIGSATGINSESYNIPNLGYGEYTITVKDAEGLIKVLNITLLDELIQIIPCIKPLDILILNDVSGSVNEIEYNESKQFFIDFSSQINIGTGPEDSRAAIAEWSSNHLQELKIPLTGDTSLLFSYNDAIRSFSDGTSPHEAMEFGRSYLDANSRPEAEKVLILSTDGNIGQISSSLIALADEFKAEGYHIITIAFDGAFSNLNTRETLKGIASVNALAPGAPAYSLLDTDLAKTIAYNYLCPIDPGSSASAYFNRDGGIEIIDITQEGNCPFPDFVEVTIIVSAYRELSIPAGTPITFYHNDPNLSGSTQILTWLIPCAIPVDSMETYIVALPVDGPSNIFAVLNDNGEQSLPINFPITTIEEIAYSNNIDNERFCVDEKATIQAIKFSSLPIPSCDTIVTYTINICNISEVDAFGVTVTDIPPNEFVLNDILFNDNGCTIKNGGLYDIPAGCCFSLYLTYDVSLADLGYYGDQGVDLDGPTNQTYFDFDGSTTSDEDVTINGNIDCPSTVIEFSKAVNIDESCDDGFVEFTFTINNELNIPLKGLSFTDILPDPCTWAYIPYGESGLSIGNSEVDGVEAIFTIDEVKANTIATFYMDASLNSWTNDGTLSNTATLENVPDVINGGITTLTSNTTNTQIIASPKITLPDTIIVNVAQDTVFLPATLSSLADVTWTTGGDGQFIDNNIENAMYLVGTQDTLNGQVMLFLSATSDCNETGEPVLIQFVDCNLEVEILEIAECDNMGTPFNGSDDSYDVRFIVTGNNVSQDSLFVISVDSYMDTLAYFTEYTVSLSADGIEEILSFTDLNFRSCISDVFVNQEICIEECTLIIEELNISDCENNGTPQDSTDDYYVVNFSATTDSLYYLRNEEYLYGPFESNAEESISLPADGISDTLLFSVNESEICFIKEVVNQNNCFTDIAFVDTLEIIIPNVFTPNGDQTNDEWTVTLKSENIKVLDCSIFDRWGNMVYYSSGITPIWNGRNNLALVTEGVYIYVISYSDENQNPKQVIGNITVLH